MGSTRESIHLDTHVDVESELKEKDELKNIQRRNLFLKIYISLILLVNLMIFASSQLGSINDIFLISGMSNIAISGASISYYYTSQGIKQGFTNFRAPGGMLANMGVIENESSWKKSLDQSRFTVFNPSITIYLFTIPMFFGAILIVLGFFIV
ncbi:MAG: hypothetical protein GPJ54_17770 [Candidatus Heimdallarchaeota archaeon]|nr:hypothetical protein [Candidatus Heimdallarchaeota archaeon]